MKIKLSLILLLWSLISSCDDIFIKDISNTEITIECPKDGFTTSSTSEILFWWDNLDGATRYDLQIVSPDFTNITQLNLDVSIDSCKYTLTLPSGNYQWRIRASNDAYVTQFTTRNLFIKDAK
jgi:hypothetical protein